MNTTSSSSSLTYLPDEVARLLRVSRRAVYRRIERGEIPSLRLGRRVLIPKAALDALLASPPRRNGASGNGDAAPTTGGD